MISGTDIRKKSITITASKLAVFGSSFALNILLIRWLGASQVGSFLWAFSIIQTVSIYSTLGTDHGLTYYLPLNKSQTDAHKARIVNTTHIATLSIAITISIILYVHSDYITNFLGKQQYSIDLKNTAILVAPITFGLISHGILKGTSSPEKYAIAELINSAWKVGAAVLLYVYDLNSIALPISYAAGYIASTTYVAYSTRMQLTLGKSIFKTNGKDLISLFRISWPLAISGYVTANTRYLDILILGFLLPFSESDKIAVFSQISAIAAIGTLFTNGIHYSSAAVFTNHWIDNKKEALETLTAETTKWLLTITLFLFFGTIISSKFLLSAYGSSFTESSTQLIILSAVLPIQALAGPSTNLLQMTGNAKMLLKCNILLVGIKVTLFSFLIPKYGLTGATISILIAQIIATATRHVAIKKIIRVNTSPISALRYITPITIAYLISVTTGTLSIESFIIKTAVALLFYIAGAILLLYLFATKEDRAILSKSICIPTLNR